LNPEFKLSAVLSWAANPVLVLFFGGFVIGVAMRRHGIDRQLAHWTLRLSRGSTSILMIMAMSGTAFLSMWMSNIAAASIMIAALRPIWRDERTEPAVRTAMLLSVAFAADFGGMATPIGTGPNAIAIASLESSQRITFVKWMSFALPLTLGMLILSFVLIRLFHPFKTRAVQLVFENSSVNPQAKAVTFLFAAAALAWLLEPLHGISAPIVALVLSAALFATGLLKSSDLGAVDWQTLLLIAGGLVLGELVERSGIVHVVTNAVAWNSIPRNVMIFSFVVATAFLSAIASNTAAAAMLIPLSLSIDSSPAIAVLLATGASMGVPFVISTPQNAMAYGEGGFTARDLLIPGLILMLAGCLIVSLTGERVLSAVGVR
jgi:sodium-dependent dicarboxylate transporter 2/3/5